jgi:hypothetical protein
MSRWFGLKPCDETYFDTAPHVYRFPMRLPVPPARWPAAFSARPARWRLVGVTRSDPYL